MRLPRSAVNNLSMEAIRETFSYCSETGELIWLKHDKPALVGTKAGRKQFTGTSDRGHIYVVAYLCGNPIGVHRLVWMYHHGPISKGSHIDHIDGNSVNNRIENLRVASPSENGRNASLRDDSSSEVLGVRQETYTRKWVAYIRNIDGKLIHLGTYETKRHAIIARKAADRALGFHENHGKKKVEINFD